MNMTNDIYSFLSTDKKLTGTQIVSHLKDEVLFVSLQKGIETLLSEHQRLSHLSKQHLKIMKANLKSIEAIASSLTNSDHKFEKISELCKQLLCQLLSMHKTASYYEPLVLELKDYLKALETQNNLHRSYYHLLHFLDPVSLVLLGIHLALDKTQLPEFTATKKLIKIIEKQEEPMFSPEERTQFYKGHLGQIIEKYHLSDLLLDQHTHLPMQK